MLNFIRLYTVEDFIIEMVLGMICFLYCYCLAIGFVFINALKNREREENEIDF